MKNLHDAELKTLYFFTLGVLQPLSGEPWQSPQPGNMSRHAQ
jgi:hypothetical protein